MSLRSWLSRSLFGLGVFCAVCSFALPAPLGPRLGSLAIICAIFSLLVWRGWKPPAYHWQATEPSMLEPEGLIEAGKRVHRSCAASADLEGALRAVASVFTQELGAQALRAGRIAPHPQGPRFTPLRDPAQPRQGARSAKPGPSGELALREGRHVTDAALGHALLVQQAGQPIALIEFDALLVQVPGEAMAQLLALAATELGRVASREMPLGEGPPFASAAPVLAGTASAPEFLPSVRAELELALFVLEPEHHRLVAISRRAERDFAARRQRVLGKTITELFSAAAAEQLQHALDQVLASGLNVEHSLHWSTPRGQRGANVSWCALRNADGSLRWLVAMAREIESGPYSRAERRSMPRHGHLLADAPPEPVTALPRPVAVVSRQNDRS